MRLSLSTVGVLLGACLLAVPAQAATLAVSKTLSSSASGNLLLLQVQYHHRHHHGDAGAAAAGAAIGLAIGAIAAGEAARREQAVEYCMQRYRSYNPETGIWIDRRGRPHQCP